MLNVLKYARKYNLCSIEYNRGMFFEYNLNCEECSVEYNLNCEECSVEYNLNCEECSVEYNLNCED